TDTICTDTLVRTWTVVDSCQLIPGTLSGIFTHVQNIYIGGTPPIIIGPTDTILYIDPATCLALLGNGTHSAEGCNLIISNSVNDDPSLNIRDFYPVGTTTVIFNVREVCSNDSIIFTFNIEVRDTVDIKFDCVKTFPEITDNMTVDDNVNDHIILTGNCIEDLVITASYSDDDVNDTIRTYFCSGILLDFPITIYYWSEGVVLDSCFAIVTPLDPDGFCTGALVTVAGSVRTSTSQNVPGVSVNLYGSNIPANVSNQAGHYKFPLMNPGGEYDVVPLRNDHPLEGVSTLDLIYLQRHILGTELLNSPYKMIAGDINKDDKITAADIVQLRKLILGIYNEFPNNKSWRMVDAGYVFHDNLDPFITPFPEKYHINNLNNSMSINWIGVKTGDVNSSYTTNINTDNLENRSESMTFDIENMLTQKGDNIIPVMASIDEEITGFQIAIQLNNATELSIEKGVLSIEDYHYYISNGYLMISWFDPNGVSLKKGDKLFEIRLNTNKASNVANHLSNDPMVMNAEYYNTSNETRSLNLNFVKGVNEAFNVRGNIPNPWNNETTINFYMPESGNVLLKVRDVTGRLVYTSSNNYTKGMNSILITKAQLGVSGLMFYDLTFKNEVKTMKMLNIK
ncbi:MAG: hypothetical protein H7X99_11480, partial [Saprospiraceae bacterium]|nr:hypothetical protein [Saprospiraceae bacterium]